jgi:hypothetical protein
MVTAMDQTQWLNAWNVWAGKQIKTNKKSYIACQRINLGHQLTTLV